MLGNSFHVAHIVSYFDPELGYEENNLGPAQSELGVEVTVITSDLEIESSDNGGKFNPGSIDHQGTRLIRLSTNGWRKKQSYFGLKNLGETLHKRSPDIVHLHSPVGLLTIQALRACQKLDIPVVIDSHLCYFNLQPYSVYKRLFYWAHKHLLLPRYRDSIRRWVPLTEESGELLNCELGIPFDVMSQNTLGAWTAQFAPDSDARSQIRAKHDLDDDSRVVLFAGRVVEEKRVDLVIKALEDSALRQVILLIVGPITDRYKAQLIESASDNVVNRLVFAGAVDHDKLALYFSAADVGIWPGDGSISIIDAMACGLPVVLSRSASTSHLIVAGNGADFEADNVDELKSVLSRLMIDDDLRSKMGHEARRQAMSVYDWSRVAQRSIEIYQKVLTGAESTPRAIW